MKLEVDLMNNKKIFFCGIILFTLFLVGFVNGAEFNSTNSYNWLYNEVTDSLNEGRSINTEDLAISIIVLNSEAYDIRDAVDKLRDMERSDKTWGNIKDSSLAVLALDELGYDVDEEIAKIETMQKSYSRNGDWLIQVISQNDNCRIADFFNNRTYDNINIENGNINLCNDYWINIESCLRNGRELGIRESFSVQCRVGGASLLYREGDDYYLIDQGTGRNTVLSIENGCLGGCDFESTAYASWLFKKIGRNLPTKAYLQSNANEANFKDIALMYLITRDEQYSTFLEESQTFGSWGFNALDSSYVLYSLSKNGLSGDVIKNGKEFLATNQRSDGSVNGRVIDTAWALMNFLGNKRYVPPVVVNPPNNTEYYMDCVNNTCVSVEGDRNNQCSVNANCVQNVSNTCNLDGNCSIYETSASCPEDCLPLGGGTCGDYVLDAGEECDVRYDSRGERVEGDDYDCEGLCNVDECACLEEQVSCNQDSVCDWQEDCSCSDCTSKSWCVTSSCNKDNFCDSAEDCSCSDCYDESFCTTSDCNKDNTCDLTEDCSCSDCKSEPECSGTTGGAGAVCGDGTCDVTEDCSCSDCSNEDFCTASGGFPWWIITIVFILLIGLGGFYGYSRYKKGGKFSLSDLFKKKSKGRNVSFSDYLKSKEKPASNRVAISQPKRVAEKPKETKPKAETYYDSKIEKELDESIKKAKELLKGK